MRLLQPLLLALVTTVVTHQAVSFPPLPPHTVYGVVRDEFGNPLISTTTEVILETPAGTTLTTTIVPGLDVGTNYRIEVPVDAGLTPDLYRPTAMNPSAPFRMKVKIGGRTYLPIEMKASMAKLGQASESSRVDLTLGEDTDGDGLPDAWERDTILAGNLGLTLEGLKPGDRLNGNPLTVLDAYIAGTYAWDPTDGFLLEIRESIDSTAVMEFVALRGRSYTVSSSNDLKDWTQVDFKVQGDPTGSSIRFFKAQSLKRVRVSVQGESGESLPKFFKLNVN